MLMKLFYRLIPQSSVQDSETYIDIFLAHLEQLSVFVPPSMYLFSTYFPFSVDNKSVFALDIITNLFRIDFQDHVWIYMQPTKLGSALLTKHSLRL
ncbi:hypothetical protein AYI69_g5749 [Smittium culicis]|uniref:Uncharacterized protein n=1 Tax=Smittium culicis TaxID=133412 RepID=A0A1R1Y3K0_9FUNG|nr:hypothetical protein AYI69_g5749 [Smittium culicis]